jgi:hypothetical protein
MQRRGGVVRFRAPDGAQQSPDIGQRGQGFACHPESAAAGEGSLRVPLRMPCAKWMGAPGVPLMVGHFGTGPLQQVPHFLLSVRIIRKYTKKDLT